MNPTPMGRVMSAMRFWERKQEAISHNLANVSTRGFKGERVFAEMVDGVQGIVMRSSTNHSSGAVSQTDGALDIALEGKGFLVVETDKGTRLSRGGSFQLNEIGQLVDESGARVLGQGGDIVLPPGKVEIADDGRISVEGEMIDTLRIEGATPSTLQREDGVYFIPEPGDRNQLVTDVRVRQGYLEESNINPVDSMVEMIDVMRAYGTLQRSAQALDGLAETVANDLSRVG